MSNCCPACAGTHLGDRMIVPYVSNRPLRGTRHLAGGRLGALGTSDTVDLIGNAGLKVGASVAGTAAGAAVGTALGIGGGAAAGALAGSVVPVIGTVIGAVIGILTSKLFGHANYAAVYANIDNVVKLFQAYEGVAGQYVGRQYGWPEIQQIWHGAQFSGLFTGIGPPPGVACTQAMISQNINACGKGALIDDLLGSDKPTSPGTDNIAELIAGGLAKGITDPVTMTQQVLVPGITTIAARKNNAPYSITGSQNPALYTQLLLDTADYMMSTVNPNMPAYYGSQNIQPLPTNAPAQSAPVAVPYSTAQSATPQVSAPITIHPGDGQAIVTNYGLVTFINAPDGTGNYPMTANGAPFGTLYGNALMWDGQGTLTLSNSSGAVYRYIQGVWSQVQAATALPVTTSSGAAITAPVIPVTATPSTVAAAGGTVAPVDATAAYIAQLQAQGASNAAALQSAIAQLQAQGMSAQAAQSTVAAAAVPYVDPSTVATFTPQATPVVNTAGLSGASSGYILAGLGILAVIFATARPKKSAGRRP